MRGHVGRAAEKNDGQRTLIRGYATNVICNTRLRDIGNKILRLITALTKLLEMPATG